MTPSIDKAVGKGVAVMCFDSDAPDSKRFAYYGTDDKACGQKTVDVLAKAMGEKGNDRDPCGQPERAESAKPRRRRQGSPGEVSQHEAQRSWGFLPCGNSRKGGGVGAKRAERQSRGSRAGRCLGGWPLFTADALKWPAGSIKVVAVDALPSQLHYVKNGYVEALLAQDCYGWGAKSIDILLNKIVNNQAPPEVKLIDPLTLVTKENVDAFGENWKKSLTK